MIGKELLQTNSRLASSAQQSVRDQALDEVVRHFSKEKKWFDIDTTDRKHVQKNLRVVWEGFFFMFWHSDKSVYQRDTAAKITNIMKGLGEERERQMQWFEAFLYIFNKHWNIVDNFRIDKYLMFLRLQFNVLFQFLKSSDFKQEEITWLNKLLTGLMSDSTTALGIPLQICDIYLPELCKVDGQQIGYESLATLLKPFLVTYANTKSRILADRIQEKIFSSLLESNVTQLNSSDEDSSSEEDLTQVDGGKMSKRTRKEVAKLVNTKYVFPNFNILLYAENHIYQVASAMASSEDGEKQEAASVSDAVTIREENREQVYNLYYTALKLEPEPKKAELTFTERQLVARARQFITMKMRKRQELRTVKKGKKATQKMQQLFQQKVMAEYQRKMRMQELAEMEQSEKVEAEPSMKSASTGSIEKKAQALRVVPEASKADGDVYVAKQAMRVVQQDSTGSDDVLTVTLKSKQSEKREKKKAKKAAKRMRDQQESTTKAGDDHEGPKKRRVVFSLENNKTREFFQHSKVATRPLPNYNEDGAKPLKAAIKKSSALKSKREDKLQSKRKVQF